MFGRVPRTFMSDLPQTSPDWKAGTVSATEVSQEDALGPSDSAPIGGGTAFVVNAIPWPHTLVQLRYCLVPNPRHVIYKPLITTAFEAWGDYLPAVKTVGLNLTYSGECEFAVPVDSPSLTLTLEKTSMDSPGVTTRDYTLPDLQHPNIQMKSSRVQIDARLTQSAGTFYNVLLHELGHTIGCDHPRIVPARTVMGNVVYVEAHDGKDGLRQDNSYITLQPGDVSCVHKVYERDFPEVKLPNAVLVQPRVPDYPAHKHVSGNRAINVPEFILLDAADNSITKPSVNPTPGPSVKRTRRPTPQPSLYPTSYPTPRPTFTPTLFPTPRPTLIPTLFPTPYPTPKPPLQPTAFPTPNPSSYPSTDQREPGRKPEPTITVSASANPDVQVSSSHSNVSLDTTISPHGDISNDAAVDISIDNTANGKVDVNGPANVAVVTDMQTGVSAGEGSSGNIEVSSTANPDIQVGTNGFGESSFPATMDINVQSSPQIHVTGDNANIRVNSRITPSITMTHGYGGGSRILGASPAQWAAVDPQKPCLCN